MKKLFLQLCMLLFLSITVYTKPVDLSTAKKVVDKFAKINLKSNSLAANDEYKVSAYPNESDKKIYIFEKKNGIGFILVSADDVAMPILAYSNESNFKNDVKSNVNGWLTTYSTQIAFAQNNSINSSEMEVIWNNAISGNSKANQIASPNSVAPLLKTKWDQAPFYNDKCPTNSQGRAVTGCVATAMAQVMKFWNYPTKGNDSYSYISQNYGNLVANFGTTTYDWANMPNMVVSKNDAVATLMYHCGVAVQMDYSAESSGSDGGVLAAPALIKYFGYPAETKFVTRDKYSKTDWITLLKKEIDLGRPLYYEGIGKSGGHAFVFDGYDDNNFFHINWGWSGNSDGYFSVDALSPAALGTGGGSGGFNYDQGAIIGMYAQSTTNPPKDETLTLTTSLIVFPSTIAYYDAFAISGNLKNTTANKFDGQIAAVLFNSDGEFVDIIDSVSVTLNANETITPNGFVLETSGMAAASPGDYLIAIFSKSKTGDWKIVEDGTSSNLALLTVESADVALKLWDSIKVYQNTINVTETVVDGAKPLSLTYDVGNFSSVDFTGEFTADLYSIDGKWIKELGSKTNVSLPIGNHFDKGLTFDIANIGVEAGNYLIIAWYKAVTDADYSMLGASLYKNPIQIRVSAPSILPDTYEVNNTKATATRVNLNYNTNTKKGNVAVNNINFHKGSDMDFFVFSLPKNDNFSVKIYLIDKDNSQTVGRADGAFTYLIDDLESELYDADTTNVKIASGAGTTDMYVKVFPAFAGLIGTYELRVEVEGTVSSVETDESKVIVLYPNPTDRYLNLPTDKFSKVEIMDSKGTIVSGNITILNNQLDLQNLANGKYFLKLYDKIESNPIINKTVIISK